MVYNEPLQETNRRLALAYDYVRACIERRGPQSYKDLLTDAYEWGLTRDDLFVAKRALGCTTTHGKWMLPKSCSTPPRCSAPGARRPHPIGRGVTSLK